MLQQVSCPRTPHIGSSWRKLVLTVQTVLMALKVCKGLKARKALSEILVLLLTTNGAMGRMRLFQRFGFKTLTGRGRTSQT